MGKTGRTAADARRANIWRSVLIPALAALVGTAGLGVSIAAPVALSSAAAVATPWTVLASYPPPQADLLDIACPSVTQCFAAGYLDPSGGDGLQLGGVILATNNGGQTWVDQTLPPVLDSGAESGIQAIACPSTTECFAVGTVNFGGVILGTTDGGSTWSVVEDMPHVSESAPSIACPSTNDCYAIGIAGSTANHNEVFSTSDGGVTWSTLALPADLPQLEGVSCQSATRCTLVGGGDIIETVDGGSSWTTENVGNAGLDLSAVTCPSVTTCYVGGGDGVQGATSGSVIFTSTDSGSTWTGQNVPGAFIERIACTSATDCFGGGALDYGGVMIGTTDGANWFTQALPSDTGGIDGISCPSATQCLATETGGWFGEDSLILGGPGTANGSTQTKISVGATSVATGQSVTYSATVTPTSGIGTPTGTVTFDAGSTQAGSTQLCVATVAADTASCSSTNAPVGQDSVTGVYSGDSNFVGSSAVGSLTVGPSRTAISTGPSVALPGQPVTFSATVTAVVGTGTPTGTVTFTDGSTSLCVATLEAGTGSCSSSGSPSGNLTVTGTYSGDSHFMASTATTPLSVGPASVTAVSVSAAFAQFGQQVTYSASVTPAAGTGTPTGTVSFTVGDRSLCVAILVGASGSCVSTNAPGGTDTVTGAYSGDSTFTSSSGSSSLFVYGTPTDTSMSAAPEFVSSGRLVTYSATVGGVGPPPTGSVVVTVGTTVLCDLTLVAGTGACASDRAPVGADTVTGTYSGDRYFAASTGATTLYVGRTITTVSIGPDAALGNTALTYSATVTPMAGTGTPTGTVEFSSGTTELCTATLVAGTGSCSSIGAPLGWESVTGTYSGDLNFSASTGEASFDVGATTTDVSVNPSSGPGGGPVTYSATVTPAAGPGTPTGTVTFSVGATALCMATLTGGSGSCSSPGAPPGADLVVAAYSGDPDFSASSGTTPLEVGATTTTVSVDPALVGQYGAAVSYAATVTPVLGTGTPTGTVTFSAEGATLCVATLAAGEGSCSSENEPWGAYTVTALYSGDPDYAGSYGTDVVKYSTTVLASYTPIFGHNVQFNGVISTFSSSSTGTVTFSIGPLVLCSIEVGDLNVGDGIYCMAGNVPFGTNTVTATYTGDSNNDPSSTSFTLFLGEVAVTSVSVAPAQVTQGQMVTYSATVTAPAGGSPSGSVSFSAGQSALCTATVVGGSASCSSSDAPPGADAATATYSGDSEFAGSIGWTTLVVTPLFTTTTSVAVTPNSSDVGQSIAYSATVSGPPGDGSPTGTVAFSVGAIPICHAVLAQGSAACSSSSAPAGVDTVTAGYSGDSSFAPSQAETTLTLISPPTITSFTPSSGTIGRMVTIRGLNLSGATEVMIGTTTVSVSRDTATRIRFQVPSGATSGKILVKTTGGTVKSTKTFAVT